MGLYKDWPLEALVRPPAVAGGERASAREFWEAHRARAEGLAPIDAAVVGGVHADRLGWAFLAGYQAALRVLDPELPAGAIAAFCATEARGVHPRDLETAARREGGEWVLDGEKVFATLAAEADVLLVVASAGRGEDGKNRLVVVQVAADAKEAVDARAAAVDARAAAAVAVAAREAEPSRSTTVCSLEGKEVLKVQFAFE